MSKRAAAKVRCQDLQVHGACMHCTINSYLLSLSSTCLAVAATDVTALQICTIPDEPTYINTSTAWRDTKFWGHDACSSTRRATNATLLQEVRQLFRMTGNYSIRCPGFYVLGKDYNAPSRREFALLMPCVCI